MNYGLDVKQNIPDLISWADKVNQRNDAKAKESRDNMMNLMKTIGLATAAYQGSSPTQQSAEDYYNSNWSSYSPEDQLALTNLGFNPSLYNSMNVDTNNPWGNSFGV